MRGILIPCLSALILVLAFLDNLLVVRRSNDTAVFALGVVLAGLHARPVGAGAITLAAIALDLADVEMTRLPPPRWVEGFGALLVIGGFAIHASIRHQRVVESARYLDTVRRAAQNLGRELDPGRLGAQIAEQVQNILGAHVVGLWRLESEGGTLRLLAERGMTPQERATVEMLSVGAPAVASLAVRTGHPVALGDVQAAGAEVELTRQLATSHGIHGIVAQPLRVEGQLVGVLGCAWLQRRRLSAYEQQLMQSLAAVWAAAIDKAVLYETELRHVESAQASHQGLQQFLAMVAHDLRGPLTVVLGYTRLLQRAAEVSWSPTQQRQLAALERAAVTIQRLVDDILDAARIGGGRFRVQPAPMDLVETLHQVVEAQQMTTVTHSLVLQAPAHLEGVWDRLRIVQLFTNLISNAIKYSPHGGEVLIQVRRQDGTAITCVTDHGIGMAPSQIRRIFQPFARVGREQETAGMGLGLYIARGIVEAHQGRISVESVVGQGTTFCVTLPLPE